MRVQRMRRALVLIMLLLGSGAAAACETPLRVGLYDMGVLYNAATGKGFDVDLLAELTRRTGCHFVHSTTPRARQWRDLADGQIDLTMTALETPERSRYAAFYPYGQSKKLITVRAGLARLDAEGFLAEPGLRLGVLRGAASNPKLEEIIDRLRKQPGRLLEVSGNEALVPLLKAGQIDGFLSVPLVLEDWHGIDGDVRQVDWTPDDPPVRGGLAVSRLTVSPAIHYNLAYHLADIQRSGQMRQMLERYLPPAVAAELALPDNLIRVPDLAQ